MPIVSAFFLSFLLALITYPVGVILQAFGDAYMERADVLTHLSNHVSPPGHLR